MNATNLIPGAEDICIDALRVWECPREMLLIVTFECMQSVETELVELSNTSNERRDVFVPHKLRDG